MLSASLNKTFPSFLHKGFTDISVEISNLFICFCSFDLSCPILKTKQDKIKLNKTPGGNTFYLFGEGWKYVI